MQRNKIFVQFIKNSLDKWPVSLEFKGGSVPARSNLAFIVSNRDPSVWYKNDEGRHDDAKRGGAAQV
jgi:hypothetical protein